MVTGYAAFVGIIALERLAELVISRRHAAWAFQRGGIEYGRAHFRVMQVLHGAFLAACVGEVYYLQRPFVPALGIPMGGLVLLSQALRYWAMHTLGRRWNVRVIVIPGEHVVSTGPYRYVRHPNYLAVILEGLAIPLVHGAWLTALGFTAANAGLLAVRVRCEEQALARHCRYQERLGSHPRLLPVWRGTRKSQLSA